MGIDKRRSETILYIEDDLPSRVLVRRVLEADGYQVLEAETARLGLEMALAEKPALILVDINMPETDGLEVTARLRARPEMSPVPIIAVTANVLGGVREETMAAGCSGYIEKPIDVDLLSELVKSHLGV